MAEHKHNSLMHPDNDIFHTENIPVSDATAMQEFGNKDNNLLIRNCCSVVPVFCKKNLPVSDANSNCDCAEVYSMNVNYSPQPYVDYVESKSVSLKAPLRSSLEYNTGDNISAKKPPLTFEIDLKDSTEGTYAGYKNPKHNLQKAFLEFRQKKQDEVRQKNQLEGAKVDRPTTPARMEELRGKIIAQAKKYFGVPYARKYWAPHTPEYSSPIFLDCCGLVRQVLRDLQKEIGFRLGPWNQAYMFDTLPVTVTKAQMRPGDLVFMTGVYVNPRSKKQLHDMLHVEIWLGQGDKIIGSRWNSGKVQEFDSYRFVPKSFTGEQYIFKSIDTWLRGICRSYCPEHPWRLKSHKPNSRSVFSAGDTRLDEKAHDDSDDIWQVGVASVRDVDNAEVSKSSQLSRNVKEHSECDINIDESGLSMAVNLRDVDNLEEIKSAGLSNPAKEDHECGINIDESGLAVAVNLRDVDNLEEISAGLSNPAREDNGCGINIDESGPAVAVNLGDVDNLEEISAGLSNHAKEDNECGINIDESGLAVAVNLGDVDNLEEIKSAGLSNTAREDNGCGINIDDSRRVEAAGLQDVDTLEGSKSPQLSHTVDEGDECCIISDANGQVETAFLQYVDNQEVSKSCQLLHTAKEDDECGIIGDDIERLEAASLQYVDNQEVSKSCQLSHTANEGEECGIISVDHTLPGKALTEKSSNMVYVYGTRARSIFTSTKGWIFNHRSRTTPFKNSPSHAFGQRCAQSTDRAQCHGGRSAHTTKQRQHFELSIMKCRSIHRCLESAILSSFRKDLFHNFTLRVFQDYISENVSMMVVAKFETDREKQSGGIFDKTDTEKQSDGFFDKTDTEKQSEGICDKTDTEKQSEGIFDKTDTEKQTEGIFDKTDTEKQSEGIFDKTDTEKKSEGIFYKADTEGIFAKLPRWRSQDEKESSFGKVSMGKADQIQQDEIDCSIQKDYYIAAQRETQPFSVLTADVNSNSRFQDKPKGMQGRVNCVASIVLKASSKERQPITSGAISLNVDQGVVGLHKHDVCDKIQLDSYSEMDDNTLPGFRSDHKPSALVGYSSNTSSCHLHSHGTLSNPSEQDVTQMLAFYGKCIKVCYEGKVSSGLTLNKRCKSRNLSSFRELDKMLTSRKRSFPKNIPPSMKKSAKILTTGIKYKSTTWQARMSGKVRNFPSRMRLKARNLPSKIRGEFKAHLTSKMIGRARNVVCNTPFGFRHTPKCLVNQHEGSKLALNSSLELSKDSDKFEARKLVDAESKQLVSLTVDSGRMSEIDISLDVFAAREQGMDVFESVQIQLLAVDDVSDTSADCLVYLGGFPSLGYGKIPPFVLCTLLYSNESLLTAKNNIHQHDFLSTLEKAYLNITQFVACSDFSWAHRNQFMSGQMLQLSGTQSDQFGNMNNNSSNDWCPDYTDSGNPESDDTCQIKLTSELQRMSKFSPQKVRKQVQMTSDISKQRTLENELTSECAASCLKETHRSKGVDIVYSLTNDKQRGQLVQAAEDTGLSANGQGKNTLENVWERRLDAFGETLVPVDQIYAEMEDSSRRVARYVLSQLPQPADDATSCGSDIQSHSRDMLPLRNSSHYSSGAVIEDIDSIYPSLDIINDLGEVESKGCCKVKAKDKKPDTSLGLNLLEDLGNTEIDLYAFCSVDNLDEVSTQNNGASHPTGISQELSQYLSQDTTSNDGGDEDDIDDNQIDEDDELKYFDAEKQTSRSLLQSFVRSHNTDVDDDDDVDYDDFCGSMKKTSDFSASVCHLDHKSSLFPGGGQQPKNFKITVGSEDGNKQKQRENNEKMGPDDFLKVKIQCQGGAGDSYKDIGRGGRVICRNRLSKLGQCCLPNNMQPTFFIGGANGISLVEGPLLALGWRRTADRYDERYRLKWVENKSRINYLTFREG